MTTETISATEDTNGMVTQDIDSKIVPHQQKILILGLGAFGFATARHLGLNNPDQIFYASEINSEIFDTIGRSRVHPHLYKGVELPLNIELVFDVNSVLSDVDLIISIIPRQLIIEAFTFMKKRLKDNVTILSLTKGINHNTLETSSERLESVLEGLNYTYAYMSGGMIAQEFIDKQILGADIVTKNQEVGEYLRTLFASRELDINLIIGSPKNSELYAPLKNVIALILECLETQGYGSSSLGFYFSRLCKEIENLIDIIGDGSPLCFTDYAFSGDLISTCFGAQQSRLSEYLPKEKKSLSIAVTELQTQKKIAEGYDTLKAIYRVTKGKNQFEIINTFGANAA